MEDNNSASKQIKSRPAKLSRLPKHARIQKRPLLHPAIASPHAGPSQPKVVYVSVSTPFMSTVTRVKKLLAGIEKRKAGHTSSSSSSSKAKKMKRKKGDDYVQGEAREEGNEEGEEEEEEEVYIKATSRAIPKALSLALFFQNSKDGYRVTIKTGTVTVVDDIIVDHRKLAQAQREMKEKKSKGNHHDGETLVNVDNGDDGQESKLAAAAAATDDDDGDLMPGLEQPNPERPNPDDDDDDDDDMIDQEAPKMQDEKGENNVKELLLPETQIRRMSYVQVGVKFRR